MTQRKASRHGRVPGCTVEAALNLIDGKWKGVIIYHLLDGSLRFGELHRKAGAVTQRMLTKQLRELEADGLVSRTVHPQVPPRVDYALSQKGRTLRPVILALKDWGDVHAPIVPVSAAPVPAEPPAA